MRVEVDRPNKVVKLICDVCKQEIIHKKIEKQYYFGDKEIHRKCYFEITRGRKRNKDEDDNL
ncbi:MAG: hypothetical protein WAW23_11065 [Candidatus Methanoperedens sp.]